jgi:hypothetical protein
MIFAKSVIEAVMDIDGRSAKSIKNEDVLDTVADLQIKLERVQSELARLKPLKPKFRVGQVVKYGNIYGRIFAMRTNVISTRKWEYETAFGGWVFEENLCALTDEER